ncbi:putative O-methyltransferase glim-like protein [Xylona heveae TC161]|uniref:Putative O-methyltransferase glim-like protein n=1 Tax=Xylona heveae (strain CBS 132557 / TC161) TaxID=1328760 RepID=A0A165IQ67_XYLHT|nr:putative O-methyltransferase glim-like protein [Xylona heveae TC161]KZF25222.1 putative O-methyltransferase glim-like protein [Xylona heveae TC161]
MTYQNLDATIGRLLASAKDAAALLEEPLAKETESVLTLDKDEIRASGPLNKKIEETIQILDKVQKKLTPPHLTLMDDCFDIIAFTNSKVLLCAAEYKIADIVNEKPLTTAEIAEEAHLHADAVVQLMRYLLNMGYFNYDTATGRYSNNMVSNLLRRDHWAQWHNWITFYPDEYYDLIKYLPEQVKADEKRTAAELYYKTDKPIYQYLAETGRTARFHKAIGTASIAEAPGLLADYPWQELGKETLCDVGAGAGDFVWSYLHRFPQATAAAFELPQTVELIQKRFDAAEPTVSTRLVGVHGGDFFQVDVPSHPAYLLKWVLHNWSDDECVMLLQKLRRALVEKPGVSRVLVMEAVLVEGRMGRMGRYGDIRMLTRCKTKERTLDDYALLAQRSGWKIHSLIFPRGCLTHIMDLRPMAES